jgi:hypothetical protein
LPRRSPPTVKVACCAYPESEKLVQLPFNKDTRNHSGVQRTADL